MNESSCTYKLEKFILNEKKKKFKWWMCPNEVYRYQICRHEEVIQCEIAPSILISRSGKLNSTKGLRYYGMWTKRFFLI